MWLLPGPPEAVDGVALADFWPSLRTGSSTFIIGLVTKGPDATQRSPRVLVVEDDRETRSFYSSALAGDGFRIEQAHNGHQALEKALDSPPDLIVTDIAVPGLDGIELCRRLRADVRTQNVPVLAITGYGDRHYSDRARLAGADHVLSKPCDVEVLIGEARRLLGSNGGRDGR